MSRDHRGERFCDTCACTITNAARVYRGRDYCRRCYKRLFTGKACGTCQRVWRVLKTDPTPLPCPTCAAKDRTCWRCSRPIDKAGMIVEGHAICNACTPHFREEQPCQRCGELTRRPTRAPTHGIHDLICERCYARLTHRTCSRCHRYRPLAANSAEDKPLCADCLPGSETTHPCPSCGIVLPGRGIGRCVPCLNRPRLLAEADVRRLALSHPWCRDLYVAYALWLGEHQAHIPIVAQRFAKHFTFFVRLDAAFETLEEITAESLVAEIPPAEIREYVWPMRFLANHRGIILSRRNKQERCENDRCDAIIERTRDESWADMLQAYATWLTAQETSLLTKRLYLRAAESFCQEARLNGSTAWTTAALIGYLKRHRGHRASLCRFVSYCRDVVGWDVSMPSKAAAGLVEAVVPETIDRLHQALNHITAEGVEVVALSDLQRALGIALGFTQDEMIETSWRFEMSADQGHLVTDQQRILLPSELIPIAAAWDRRRRR